MFVNFRKLTYSTLAAAQT